MSVDRPLSPEELEARLNENLRNVLQEVRTNFPDQPFTAAMLVAKMDESTKITSVGNNLNHLTQTGFVAQKFIPSTKLVGAGNTATVYFLKKEPKFTEDMLTADFIAGMQRKKPERKQREVKSEELSETELAAMKRISSGLAVGGTIGYSDIRAILARQKINQVGIFLTNA